MFACMLSIAHIARAATYRVVPTTYPPKYADKASGKYNSCDDGRQAWADSRIRRAGEAYESQQRRALLRRPGVGMNRVGIAQVSRDEMPKGGLLRKVSVRLST
jgi:hypothetical protein